MRDSFLKRAAYGVLDLITPKTGVRRKINNRIVRFPARWSRYFPSEYEPDNYAFLEQHVKEGMCVIDIGAHIGLFSVVVSQLTGPKGKNICFEPTPGTFSILKETLRLNHCDNVLAMQEAVGLAPGRATFYVSNVNEGCNSNSLVSYKDKKEAQGFDVVITSVDVLCKKHNIKPDLVKIDVEGAELDVLKGGTSTWKTAKPIVILGLHPQFITSNGDSLKEIWDLIKGYDYKIILNGLEMSETDFLGQTDIFDVQLITT